MAIINVLSDMVVNKIAAGEVIERPASVVKELVENSIDAGASRITVEVEEGGMHSIRVVDDGVGMEKEDAVLAIERHATSKIRDDNDIDRISTLGFRGEALPSIFSVSMATLETRPQSQTYGTRLVVKGGTVEAVLETGMEPGTTIEVRNLFFNVPARRKFLRAETTELNYIRKILYDCIVSTPGIDLELVSNGKSSFVYRGSPEREDMLPQIFGESISKLMVPVEFATEGTVISGYIGKPETARKASTNIYIVLNGRPISSKSIMRGLLDGYGSALVRGLYPSAVIFIEVDPSLVDVNVHPTKKEVRIYREYVLMNAVRENVAGALNTIDSIPNISYHPPRSSASARPVTVYNPPDDRWSPEIPRSPAAEANTLFTERDGENEAERAQSAAYRESTDGPSFWQMKDRYIMTSVKEGAIIIDQHVAHERILYEEFLSNFKGREASAQQLLFPMVLDYSAADYDILQPMIPFLKLIGFGIGEFGERSVMIDAVPSWKSSYSEFSEKEILNEYIDEMRIHGKLSSGYIEKLAAALACRTAIKSGKLLSQEEMRYLVDRLFATSSPFTCPHGRPTVVRLTMDELDRRFGR